MMDLDNLVFALARLFKARNYRFHSMVENTGTIPVWRIVQPDFLLPVFVRLAEDLWRAETLGNDFGITIEKDSLSLTGFRITAIRHIPNTITLLAINETIQCLVNRNNLIVVETLMARIHNSEP